VDLQRAPEDVLTGIDAAVLAAFAVRPRSIQTTFEFQL
jgi:hypothetical protein